MPQLAGAVEQALALDALDVVRLGLCVAAADGRVLMMNPTFAQALGLVAGDHIGKSIRAVLAGASLVPRFEELISLQEGDVAVEIPVGTAERTSLLLMKARTADIPNFARCRVITVCDVLDLGMSPASLGETQRRLESINSSIVVSDCRLPDMPIVMVNGRFKAMTGYAPEEVIGRNCRFLQGDDRNQLGLIAIREAIAHRRGGYAVLRNYRRGGAPFLNELLISPIMDRSGTVTHYVAVQRELTSARGA